MAQTRLVRLILWVQDPAQLSNWYCKTFGWQELVNEVEEGWVELDANGFILALHGGAQHEPGYWPKLQIAVGDVADYRDRLIASGVEMGEIQQWNGLEWSECSDPEGNTVQICNR